MRKDIEVRRGASPAQHEETLPAPLTQAAPLAGMFSFRYASTEVYAHDGQMHVRMKQSEYRDGRLRTEECEGTLDRQAAQRMMAEAQQQFLAQAFGFARLLLAPLLGRTARRDD